MSLILPIAIGVIAGYLRGGRLVHIAALKLRLPWLVAASFIIQLLIFPVFTEHPLFPYATEPLHYVSYGLVFTFIAVNYRMLPLVTAAVGAGLNLVVIAVNGGYMPASAAALSRAGVGTIAARLTQDGIVGNVRLMGEDTVLNLLGDVLYLPSWVPLSTAFSAGDLVLGIGLGWLIAHGMVYQIRDT